jgi:hypothetical protein
MQPMGDSGAVGRQIVGRASWPVQKLPGLSRPTGHWSRLVPSQGILDRKMDMTRLVI